MAWFQNDILAPNFDGPLLENKFIKSTLFLVKTRTQRNNEIKKLFRQVDSSTMAMCYVSADAMFYELINDPSTDVTQDSDWQAIDFSLNQALLALGTWDASNTNPVLQDTDSVGKQSSFYTVDNASTPRVVQYSGLFGGQSVTVKNGDLIISNNSLWFISPAATTWAQIDKPQVIDDYVTGIVIAHTHVIADVTNLQVTLDSKYDTSNAAVSSDNWDLIDPLKITTSDFIKQYIYRKFGTGVSKGLSAYSALEVDNLIAGITLGIDNLFNWDRPINKVIVAGETVGGQNIQAGLEKGYFGKRSVEVIANSVDPMQVGDNQQPRFLGQVNLLDADEVNSIQVLDEGDVVVYTETIIPSQKTYTIDALLTALTPVDPTTKTYKLKVVSVPDSSVPATTETIESDPVPLQVVYPILYGMAAPGLVQATFYANLLKRVATKSEQDNLSISGTDKAIYIAVPSIYGAIDFVEDESRFNTIGVFNVAISDVDSSGLSANWTHEYRIYELPYIATQLDNNHTIKWTVI